MLQRLASTALVVGTLLTASLPVVGLAQNRNSRSGGGRTGTSGRSAEGSRSGAQSFTGGSRNYAPRSFSGGSRYSGGQSFVSPRGNDVRRGYSSAPRSYGYSYAVPRSYGRPVYRGYYNRGIYLGYGVVPYGYSYDPGYVYDPGYAYDQRPAYEMAPAPQACQPGSYDQYGNWVPNPNCYSSQEQYPAPQQNYNPNQPQYQQPQQNYDPNQPRYPQP